MVYHLILLAICFIQSISLGNLQEGLIDDRPHYLVAYDVGSTTTRLEIAKKDANGWQILWSHVDWISTFHLDEAAAKGAFLKFLQARSKAHEQIPVGAKMTERGVGTAGLRGSGEWGVAFEQWVKELGIDFRMISQEEESLLGLKATKFRLGENIKHKNFCIWDIGGGSAQLMCETPEENVVSGSEISVRNAHVLWSFAHCMVNDEIADELSCKFDNLFSRIRHEEELFDQENPLKLFPLKSLGSIKKIVQADHLIFGIGPVHQYYGLDNLKTMGLIKEGSDYHFEALDQLMRVRARDGENEKFLNLLPIYITLVLLNKPTVRVVPEVNNALGLIY